MMEMKTAGKLSRQQSSHPLIGPQRALGISAKVARGVITDWTSRKHEEYWQSIHGQRQSNGFLKRHSGKRAGELLNLNRNQLRLLTGHNHLNTSIYTGAGRVLGWKDANSHLEWPCLFFVTLSGTGDTKIQAPGPAFRETR